MQKLLYAEKGFIMPLVMHTLHERPLHTNLRLRPSVSLRINSYLV